MGSKSLSTTQLDSLTGSYPSTRIYSHSDKQPVNSQINPISVIRRSLDVRTTCWRKKNGTG
jgi:hypothetical protein